MKKFLALALALAMTLSLAACGGKTDDSASDEEASGTNEPAETPEKPADDKHAHVCLVTAFSHPLNHLLGQPE